MARINLYKKYPESLKLVHLLPAVFTAGSLLCIVCAVLLAVLSFALSSPSLACWSAICVAPILLYSLLVMVDSTVKNSSLKIGLLSVPAAFTQLWGYGLGFFHAWWLRCVRGKGETNAFSKTFYK